MWILTFYASADSIEFTAFRGLAARRTGDPLATNTVLDRQTAALAAVFIWGINLG